MSLCMYLILFLYINKSNIILILSFRYFTKKWQRNANYQLIVSMYNAQEFLQKCPCEYIIAFNICRLNNYKGYNNLTFNNEYSMRSLHFSQKITSHIEMMNLEIIFNKTDILTQQHYDILKKSLPASTIVSNTKKMKDIKNLGVEQVRKMLKRKSNSIPLNNTNIKNNENIINVFGKKYTNYFPVNIICVYNKNTENRLPIKKEDKARVIKSIMNNTEKLKNMIMSGKTKLIECKHENFTKEFHQLRAADEAAHRILTCNDCGRIFNVKS